MQGKGTVRFFLIVMIAVCLYQFLLVLPTQRVDKNAEEYAENFAANFPEEEQEEKKRFAMTSYLDSMSNEVVFSIPLLKDFTYTELKSSQLNYGLDLKGGMSVILQVDLREFLRTLANDSKDPTFLKALEKASEAQKVLNPIISLYLSMNLEMQEVMPQSWYLSCKTIHRIEIMRTLALKVTWVNCLV